MYKRQIQGLFLKARVSPVAGYIGQSPKPLPVRKPVPDSKPPEGASKDCGSKPISEYALIQAGFEQPEEEQLADPTDVELQGIGLLQEKGLFPIEGNRDYKEAIRIVGNYLETGKLTGLPLGKPAPEMPPDKVDVRPMQLQRLHAVGEHVVANGLWQRRTIKARPPPKDVTVGGYDGASISTSEVAASALAQADNDLMVTGSAFAYWQSEAVFYAESFSRAIGQIEEWQRLYNASARNRNAICKGITKFLRDAVDKFEAGEPISCEGLAKLNGVSHLIAIEAQKVAQSGNVDLDRCLGEVDECLPRLKKARLEPVSYTHLTLPTKA